MRRGVWVAGALMAILAILPRNTAAAETTPSIWLDYRAPHECPTRDELLAALHARTERFRLVDAPSSGVTTYRITLSSAPAGADGWGASPGASATYVGHLEIVEPGGATALRDLGGDTCHHVADAIALVAALGIDPNAATAPAPEPPPPPLPVPEVSRHAPSRSRFRSHATAALAVTAVGGVSPRILASPAGTLEATLHWAARGNGLHPMFGARATLAQGSATAAGVGSELATFTWTAGRLDLCPVEGVLGILDALVCIGGEGGNLEATGSGVTIHHDVVAPWFALGPVVRLKASIAGPLFLEVELLAMAPLTRGSVYFDRPFKDLYDVPPLAGRATVGVGFRFW